MNNDGWTVSSDADPLDASSPLILTQEELMVIMRIRMRFCGVEDSSDAFPEYNFVIEAATDGTLLGILINMIDVVDGNLEII